MADQTPTTIPTTNHTPNRRQLLIGTSALALAGAALPGSALSSGFGTPVPIGPGLDPAYAAYLRARETISTNHGLNQTRRRVHLLSGLLTCGVCGGRYSIISQDRYGCFDHHHRGICSNNRSIKRQIVEERLLSGLRDKLIDPEIVREMIREMQAEANRKDRERRLTYDLDKKSLAEVDRKIEGVLDMIGDEGVSRRSILKRIDELEEQKVQLEERLTHEPQKLPALHPGIADIYRDKVANLSEALGKPEVAQVAGDAIRALIDRIILTPGKKRGEMEIALHGELDAVLHFMTQGETAENRPSQTEGRFYCVRGCGGPQPRMQCMGVGGLKLAAQI